MHNTRLILTHAALRAALLLTRLARWAMPPCQLAAPFIGGVATAPLNFAAGSAAKAPPSSSRERRGRLDIPFFVETDTEIIAADSTGPLKPKAHRAWPRATATSDLLKFRPKYEKPHPHTGRPGAPACSAVTFTAPTAAGLALATLWRSSKPMLPTRA